MSTVLLAAALVGLAGGVHCAAMCGGVVAAVGAQPAPSGMRVIPIVATPPRLRMQLAYNLGRITTYALLGALVGALGSGALLLRQLAPVERLLFGGAHLFLIAIGLYLLGWLPGLRRIEGAGLLLWRRVQPALSWVLPVTTPPRALAMGLLWGFVPCGMVYTLLLSALFSGSAWNGGLLMLAFGLGTLPNVLGLGLLAGGLRDRLRGAGWRRAGGVAVLFLGALGVYHATLPVHGLLDALCLSPGGMS